MVNHVVNQLKRPSIRFKHLNFRVENSTQLSWDQLHVQ